LWRQSVEQLVEGEKAVAQGLQRGAADLGTATMRSLGLADREEVVARQSAKQQRVQAQEAAQLRADYLSQQLGEDNPQTLKASFEAEQLALPSYAAAAGAGVQRGIAQVQEIVPTAKGLVGELSGDREAIDAAQAEVGALHAGAPKAVVPTLSDVYDADDFTYWLVEQLGEQAPVMAGTIASGGLGGGLTALVGAGLVRAGAMQGIKLAPAAIKGAVVGAFAGGTSLETAATAQEQFELTGGESYNPGLSLMAGMAKGALEVYTPLMLGKGLLNPGKHIFDEAAKSAVREGVTETAQELVDVGAKKYTDPTYSFFSGETGARLLESGAAGFFVGGAFGGGATAIVKGVEQVVGTPGKSLPGQYKLSAQEIERMLVEDEGPVRDGPLTTMRKWARRKTEASDVAGPEVRYATKDDGFGVNQVGRSVRDDWAYALGNERDEARRESFEDDNLPRYAVLAPDGQRMLTLYTAAEAEEAAARLNVRGPEGVRFVEVNMRALQPAAISADVWDLPTDPTDQRVTFLPGVSSEVKAQALRDYAIVARAAAKMREQRFDYDPNADSKGWIPEAHGSVELHALYEPVLAKGLRVVPSAKASFVYAGDGTIAGTNVDRPDSKRGLHVVSTPGIDPRMVGSKFYAGIIHDKEPGRARHSSVFAIDYSKVPDGSVYARPFPTGGIAVGRARKIVEATLVFPKTLTEAQQIEVTEDFVRALVYGRNEGWFADLYKQGIYLRPTSQVKDLVMVVGKRLPDNAIVRGSEIPGGNQNFAKAKPVALKEVTLLTDEANLLQATPRQLEAYNETIKALRLLAPILTKVLNGLGMKPGLRIKLAAKPKDASDQHNIGPFYDQGNYAIWLDADSLLRLTDRTGYDLLVILQQGLLHELGHAITLETFAKLPDALKTKVYRDYELARLRHSYNGSASSAAPSIFYNNFYNGRPVATPEYYLTFGEYLAEQMRRWLGLEKLAYDEVNVAYSKMADKLNDYYQALVKQVPAKIFESLNVADPSMYEWAKMLEDLAAQGIESMALKLWEMPQLDNVPQDLEVTEQLVRQAIEQYKRLIPADVRVLLERENGIARGGFSESTRTLKLVLGALADNGSPNIAARTVVHEAFHAIESVLTPEERSALLREADRVGALPTAVLGRYARLYRSAMAKQGLAGEELIAAVKLKVDSEKIAVMLEGRLNGKQYETLVEKILDRLIELWNTIKELVLGQGIVNVEQVIRAFYRGEMAQRYDETTLKGRGFIRWQKAISVGPVTVDNDGRIVFSPLVKYAEVKQVDDNMFVAVQHTTYTRPPGKAIHYEFYEGQAEGEGKFSGTGKQIGYVSLDSTPKGWLIDMTHVAPALRKKGYNTKFMAYIEKDLGEHLKASGTLRDDGYRYRKARTPNEVKYHVWDEQQEFWLSPNKIREDLRKWQRILVEAQTSPVSGFRLSKVEQEVKRHQELTEKVSKEAWSDPALEQSHALNSVTFTPEMVKFVVDNYYNMDSKELARRVGVVQPRLLEELPIIAKAHGLKLRRGGLSIERVKLKEKADLLPWADLIEQHNKGATFPVLGKKYGVHPKTLSKWLPAKAVELGLNLTQVGNTKERVEGKAERNAAVLKEILSGKSYRETAAKFNITPSTVAGLVSRDKSKKQLAKYQDAKANLAQSGMVEAYRRGTELREEQLLEAINGDPAQKDGFEQLALNVRDEENNIPIQLEALDTVYALDWGNRGQNDPEVNRVLSPVKREVIRISWFSKVFFSLHQIGWRNNHMPEVRQYVQQVELWNTFRMGLITRADEVVQDWDKQPLAQREAIANMVFWATEMDYRLPHEIAAKVLRHPTTAEISRYAMQNKMTPEAVALYGRIQFEFQNFLNEVKSATDDNIRRTIADPTAQTKALRENAADFQKMAAKPYFPFTRFGEWVVTVRDPNANNKVVHFEAFQSAVERDSAVKGSIVRGYPGMDIVIGRVPEDVHEFMALPPMLIRSIKAKMPGLSQSQQDWLDQFGYENAPERSFKKRWLKRQGTPGYSMDALRVFAHYFRSGANYLARVKYYQQLREPINELDSDARKGLVRDYSKRKLLIDYMNEHWQYIMEGGKDWAKFKGLVALWQLGFSPAAALVNLTQTWTTTYPELASRFGDLKVQGRLLKNGKGARWTHGLPPRGSSPSYLKARDEAVAQGRIETGQAPELGSFAEGPNLERTLAGTLEQKAWRGVSYWGMKGFAMAEHFNREVAFKTAFELALENPRIPDMLVIGQYQLLEKNELIGRTGMTDEEATAFLFARELVDKTQFVYSPYARPAFLRGGPQSALLVFFSYTANMLYALFTSPARVRMWLVLAFLGGLAGLPGSDDLNKLLRALASFMFGKDFNLEVEARAMVRNLTKGTIFDKVGPDLVMHGISRYGFGLGLIADGYGAPRFDASANLSMGQIVPGLSPGLDALHQGKKLDEMTGVVVRDAAGAGFGIIFNLLQVLAAQPGGSEWKKWERALPRGVKAVSKGLRYAVNGEETTPQGATFAQFDMKDPDDVSTVVMQMLGFTPEKISSKYEALALSRDTQLYYKARKTALYSQMHQAITEKDTAARDAVKERMLAFNAEMDRLGLVSEKISGVNVGRSIKMRERAKLLQERGLPPNKSGISVQREVFDLFPGLESIEKKVK
jgi:hypothetical protein